MLFLFLSIWFYWFLVLTSCKRCFIYYFQATQQFSSLKVPWYTILPAVFCEFGTHVFHANVWIRIFVSGSITSVGGHDSILCRYATKVSKGHEGGYFLKQVNIPYGRTLDIIGVNTGLLQVRSNCLSFYTIYLSSFNFSGDG